MREAYCSSSNDVYKNSSISRKKKNGWETSHFPLRFSMTRSLTLFCRYFPVEHELDGTRRGFFPTKDKLQIQRRVKEGICCSCSKSLKFFRISKNGLKFEYFAKIAHKISKSKYFPNIFYDSDCPINSLSDDT